MNESERKHYEAIGVEGVLSEIAAGVFGPGKSVARNEAEAWVAAERAKLGFAADARREAREEESVSIARKALTTSRSARTIAIVAMILATMLAAVQAKDQILWLLSKLGIGAP